MAKDPQVTVRILGDGKGLDKALGSTTNALGGWAKTAIGVIGGVFAVDRVLDWSGAILTAGTRAETALVKTSTVFEDQTAAVRTWAAENAAAMGLTDIELSGLAANMGDLLKPMGFTSEQAADMSTEMLDLAGALSAWSGGTRSAAEVSEIMASAMLGEREALKGLGISIDQAEVNTRALAIAQAEGRSEITATDEALATQQLILEKSTDAQTAWADGSMDAVKAQNEWAATIKEAKETLVMALLPALQRGMRFLTTTVVPVVRRVLDVFDEDGLGGVFRLAASSFRRSWPQMRAALADMGGRLLAWVGEQAQVLGRQLLAWGEQFWRWVEPQIGPAIREVGRLVGDLLEWLVEDGIPLAVEKLVEFGAAFIEWVAPYIPPLLRELGKMLFAITQWIVTELIPAAARGIGGLAGKFLSWVADDVVPRLPGAMMAMITALGSWITNTALPELGRLGLRLGHALMNAMVEGVKNGLGVLGRAAQGVGQAIWQGIKWGINQIIIAWNKLDPRIDVSIPGWVPVVGGKSWSSKDIIPDIDRLHTGGIFRSPAGSGGVGYALLRDGEMVTSAPSTRAGIKFGGDTLGGGITIINRGVIANERQLAAMLDRARSTGTVGAGRR